jgi:acetoacetyl-CoA reductase
MKRLALVTGGIRGIGSAISRKLAQEGYDVVSNYFTQDEIAQNFHKETGIKVKRFDVSDYELCNRAAREIEDEFGTNISILVNNAGITKDSMLHKMNPSDWNSVINTNLTSCFNMCRAVICQMREKEFGRIVSISSVNGQAGQAGQTNYSAAKAGVIGFTKALARESATKNITVNAIAPGYVMTEMVANMSSETLEKIVSAIPIKRLGGCDEIARAVAFLVAQEAGFITGETIAINGGHNML